MVRLGSEFKARGTFMSANYKLNLQSFRISKASSARVSLKSKATKNEVKKVQLKFIQW